MKILRLDLRAFGPFTGQVLELSGGSHGFHVVLGSNEAGKSSALRALRQALFGIDGQTRDAFLHPYNDLRVGASLVSGKGEVLSFLRRKGQKGTVLGTDGVTLLDEKLLPGILGGLGEDEFTRMFGIDHAALVAGGAELVKGGGELGKALFAAASGLMYLKEAQEELRSEAREIYQRGGRIQKVRKQMNELSELKARVTQELLREEEFKAREKRLAQARQERDRLAQEADRDQAELTRLERVHDALPFLTTWTSLKADLAPVAGARLLAPDFPDRRRDALARERAARERERQAQEDRERLEQDLEGLEIPQALLDSAPEIEAFITRSGAIVKGRADIGKNRAKIETMEHDAREMLRDLGKEPDLDRAGELRIVLQDRRRISDFVTRRATLEARVKSLGEQEDKAKETVARLQEELEEVKTLVDTTPLRKVLERIRRVPDPEQEVAQSGVEAEGAALSLLARELHPWSGELRSALQLVVPDPVTIDRFVREAQKLAKESERIEETSRRTREALEECTAALDKLDRSAGVLSEAALTESRRTRDEGWHLVRNEWKGEHRDEAAHAAFLATAPGTSDLAGAYEHWVGQADAVADRLRREADRVVMRSGLEADIQRHQATLARARTASAELLAKQETLEVEWHSQWSSSGFAPLTPEEMRPWHDRYRTLRERLERLTALERKVTEARARASHFRAEILAICDSLGFSLDTGDGALLGLIQAGEAQCSRWEAAASRRDQLRRELDRASSDLGACQAGQADVRRAMEEHRPGWLEITRKLGVNDDAPSELILEHVARIDDLLELLKEIRGFKSRNSGIEREEAAFNGDVALLAARIAPDLANLAPDRILGELTRGLALARERATRKGEIEKLLVEIRKVQEKARDDGRMAAGDLQALGSEAGAGDPSELPALEELSGRRRQIEAALARQEADLARLAAGRPLEELVAGAREEDPDTLPARLDALRKTIAARRQEISDTGELIGGLNREHDRVDGRSPAAEALQDAEEKAAQLEETIRTYTTLHLALEVLGRTLERHRERHQDPVLTRAGALFELLTAGSFARLVVDQDDQGRPVLKGVRAATGQVISVTEMSDGTADQLYLALRIASLEVYLREAEPMPLVVDDILVSFDDERSRAALRALAALSTRTQVILFTHHRHLVDLARSDLSDNVLHVHELCR